MRHAYLDAARGVALVLMVVNHTARYWASPDLAPWPLIYATTAGAGPLFLFLVGFVLPLSWQHGSAEPVRRAMRRAAGLFAAGYIVNLVLAPEQPFLGSNVLHTIGAAILLAVPARPLLAYAGGRYALAAIGAGLYGSFVVWFAAIEAWVSAHPILAQLLFFDFPPWPWLALVLLGLSLGGAAAGIATDAGRARFYGALAGAGALVAVGALAAEWWWPATPRLAFARDFLVTNHWIPRGSTVGWVLAWVFLVVAACYAPGARGATLRPLVVLGRAAFFLYVAHHVIVVTLGRHALGISLGSWPRYWLATVLLLAALVPLAAGWTALTRRARGRAPAARARLSAAA
jgi:uncharacterized membrane protein